MNPAITALVILATLSPVALAHGDVLTMGPAGHRAAALVPDSDARARPHARGDDGDSFSIRFKCPNEAGSDDPEVLLDRASCPLYLIDREDLLGQPRLVIDPTSPDNVAINGLHGGKGLQDAFLNPTPTSRSRDNRLHQTHTTFQSTNGGATWKDNRYHADGSLSRSERDVYGEDNDMVVLPDGEAVIAGLYSWREKNGLDAATGKPFPAHWSVVTYHTERINRLISYHSEVQPLHTGPESLNRLEGISLVHSPSQQTTALMWLEHDQSSQGESETRVQILLLRPGSGFRWDPAVGDQTRGCRAVSNLVEFAGNGYFACSPGTTYSQTNETGSPDHWKVYRFNFQDGASELVVTTPIPGAHALLHAIGETGHMVLVGSGVQAGVPSVNVCTGSVGRNWRNCHDYGGRLQLAPPDEKDELPIIDARVTALAFTQKTGNLHMIYQEAYKYSEPVDKVRSAGGGQRWLDKGYAVLRPYSESFLDMDTSMQYGQPPSLLQAAPAYHGLDDSIFEDLHDSIVIWNDPDNGEERIFTAIGDFGSWRYAEVIEEVLLPAVFLPLVQTPAIPALATAANPSMNGALAGAVFGLMLLRMLAARRKLVSKIPTS